MILRISEPAKEDLLEIRQHIAAENPLAAERLLKALQEKFELLMKFPQIGSSRAISLSLVYAHFPSLSTLSFINTSKEILEIIS